MIAALNRALAKMDLLTTAAGAHGIDPALLGAIALRASGYKNIPQIGGGLGRGIFQIDIGKNPSVTEDQAYDPTFAANWGATRLAKNFATLAADHPNLDAAHLMQATAASWNLGTGGISGNPDTIDVGSAGGNYGSNVMNLMECFP
jgi:hypothetical protein